MLRVMSQGVEKKGNTDQPSDFWTWHVRGYWKHLWNPQNIIIWHPPCLPGEASKSSGGAAELSTSWMFHLYNNNNVSIYLFFWVYLSIYPYFIQFRFYLSICVYHISDPFLFVIYVIFRILRIYLIFLFASLLFIYRSTYRSIYLFICLSIYFSIYGVSILYLSI